VITPDWSDGEGGGAVHEALTRIVGTGDAPGDILCIACAGNTAQRHWSGPFHRDAEGFHQWQSGQKDNLLTPWGDDRVSAELYCSPHADYELSVHDTQTGASVGQALTRASSSDRSYAVVRFAPENGHKYCVRVRGTPGQQGSFHVIALHGYLEQTTARGSISFPADGAEVLALGAVTPEGQRMYYSACGPNSPRPKPDLVAPVPFPSFWRSQPFGGTSAAAPQAAGLAALLWSCHPNWTANKVRTSLRASANDLGPRGHDWETGYGLIHLPDDMGQASAAGNE
jgi:subtilisin family serine protease